MNQITSTSAPQNRRPWPGYFIVIEGIDGTGKSTLAHALGKALEARGIPHVESREPTQGPHGKKIRELAARGRESVTADEEVELFIADRREHVADVILPNLNAGRVVILDRYFYSTLAYQSAKGADIEAVRRRHRDFAPEPDLLVILKLDVPSALERIRKSRGSGPDHFEGAEYLAKVDQVFDALDHPHVLRLDAREPTKSLVEKVLSSLPDLWRLRPASE